MTAPRHIVMSAVLTLVAALLPATAAAAAAAEPAVAAPNWTSDVVHQPSVPVGRYSAVSCVSTQFCVAVNGHSTDYPYILLDIAVWDGSAWTRAPWPRPDVADLSGVSCASATFCVVVGADTAGRGAALRWDGTSWDTMPAPRRPTASVSCPVADRCQAVGGRLAFAWDGTAWTKHSVPVPAGRSTLVLAAVSCTAPDFCVTAGTARSNPNTLGFPAAAVWRGLSWSDTTVPVPSDSSSGQGRITTVSCWTTDACVAGGKYERSAQSKQLLIEHFDGAAWTRDVAPSLSSFDNDVFGLSCPSATFCMALGERISPHGVPKTYVDVWDGTSWTLAAAPAAPDEPFYYLEGLSCASASFCAAAGGATTGNYYTPTSALVEHWNGSGWTIRPAPNRVRPVTADLAAVSCASTAFCAAVGQTLSEGQGSRAVIELWTSSDPEWRPERTNAPDQVTGLVSVSCATARFCFAVGSAGSGPLAERWDGTRWTPAALPPSGSGSLGTYRPSALTAVSCAGPTSCLAVGVGSSSHGTIAVSARWNGTHWALVNLPSAKTTRLLGVSCSSAAACSAVGYTTASAPLPLASRWDGTAWHSTTLPLAGGPQSVELTGVACSTDAACLAVGSYQDSGFVVHPLARRYTGGQWRSTAPIRKGAGKSLTAVSCAGPTDCVVTGLGPTDAFVLGYDGSHFGRQALPDPITDRTLSGVSCAASAKCVAVGADGYGTEPPAGTLIALRSF